MPSCRDTLGYLPDRRLAPTCLDAIASRFASPIGATIAGGSFKLNVRKNNWNIQLQSCPGATRLDKESRTERRRATLHVLQPAT